MHGNWFQLEQLTFLIASIKCSSYCSQGGNIGSIGSVHVCARRAVGVCMHMHMCAGNNKSTAKMIFVHIICNTHTLTHTCSFTCMKQI